MPVAAEGPKASASEAGAPATVSAAAPAPLFEEGNDPDRPPGAPAMEPGEYLRLRSEYIGLLRGVQDAAELPYNPRVKAIRQLEKQLAQMPLANSVTWTPIGPAPIPNGQTTPSVAVSGRVTSIAIKPTDPNIVYVGTAQGGLYRTTDGGSTWTPLLDNAFSLAVGSVAIAPSDPSIVYVGTGEGNLSVDSFFGIGVYRINNAESASPTVSGPFNQNGSSADVLTGLSVAKVLVHPTDPNTIFVATVQGTSGNDGSGPAVTPSRGLFRSTNAGTTCTFTKLTVATANGGNRGVSDIVFEPGNPDNMVAYVRGNLGAGDGGLYRSTNANAVSPTFTQTLQLALFTGKLAINKVGATVTVLAETGELVACGLSTIDGRLRPSTDGGATWPIILTAADGISGGQGFYDVPVAIDPTNAQTILIGGSAAGSCSSEILRRSTNGGTSFAASSLSLHADSHAIEFAPSNASIVYTGNDGGIFKSTNGGAAWTSLNGTGFSATQFQSIAIHPTDTNFSIGGTQDNGTERYTPAATWTRSDGGDGGYALIDQNAADTTTVTMYHTYFNVTAAYAYARATTAAGSWTAYGCGFMGITANGFTCPTTAVLFYAPMARGPGNPNTVYFGTDRLWRSVNAGVNMSVVSQGPIVSSVAISSIGISPQNDNVRIVGLTNGNIWATTTGSSTLTNVTQAGMPAKFVARAVIDPNNSNTAYVTFDGYGLAADQHVWKTTNLNGAPPVWTAAGTGIPDVPTNAFVVDPRNSDHLFAGTDIGVYYSSNAGTSWSPIGTGLPRVAVFDMAIVNPSTPANRILRIATHGRGMWELTPPAATTVTAPTGGGTFCPGSMVTLSVTATGQAPLSYQWRKGMVNVMNGGGISGATTASLLFNPITAGNAGSYDCVVTAGSLDTATSTATALTAETTVPVVTAPAAATVTQTLCQ